MAIIFAIIIGIGLLISLIALVHLAAKQYEEGVRYTYSGREYNDD